MAASIWGRRSWFQSRCDRTEYWLTIGVLLSLTFAAQTWSAAACIALNLALFVLAARRLHDMGRSGWWIALIPAGQFVAVVVASLAELPFEPLVIVVSALTTGTHITLGVIAGEPGANRFGPNPSPPGRRGSSHAST